MGNGSGKRQNGKQETAKWETVGSIKRGAVFCRPISCRQAAEASGPDGLEEMDDPEPRGCG